MIMLVAGILYLKKPFPNINWMHGYRTQRSMKNQETWEFAQRYFGSTCFRWGAGIVLLTLILMISVLGRSEKIVGMVGTVIGTAQGFVMIYLLTPTERALEKKFNMSD
jgi:uncharacterized membrane protein